MLYNKAYITFNQSLSVTWGSVQPDQYNIYFDVVNDVALTVGYDVTHYINWF